MYPPICQERLWRLPVLHVRSCVPLSLGSPPNCIKKDLHREGVAVVPRLPHEGLVCVTSYV